MKTLQTNFHILEVKMNYQLEIKQIVDYPRCRIYREFIRNLMKDRSIRTNGCSYLFIISSFAPTQISGVHIGAWTESPTWSNQANGSVRPRS